MSRSSSRQAVGRVDPCTGGAGPARSHRLTRLGRRIAVGASLVVSAFGAQAQTAVVIGGAHNFGYVAVWLRNGEEAGGRAGGFAVFGGP